MSSRELNPETHNRNGLLFYNFQLDLSEKIKQDTDATNQVKNHLFFSKPMLKDLAKILKKHGFKSPFHS